MPERVAWSVVAALIVGTLAGPVPSVAAQDSLNVYCRVSVTQKGSGEVFAQIKAEAANPKAQLHPRAVRQAEQPGYRTVGIYAGALGFSFNRQLPRRAVE